MERLSDSGPKLVKHDLDDIIISDPVMLPITRTGLQQRVGNAAIAENRLIHNQEANQVYCTGNYTSCYISPLIFQAVNAVIAQIFSTETNDPSLLWASWMTRAHERNCEGQGFL